MKVAQVSKEFLRRCLGLPDGVDLATIQHESLGETFHILLDDPHNKLYNGAFDEKDQTWRVRQEAKQHVHEGFCQDLKTTKYLTDPNIDIYQQCDSVQPSQSSNERWHSGRFNYEIGDKVEIVNSDMSGGQGCRLVGQVGEIVGFNYVDSLVHVQCGEEFISLYEHRLRRVSKKGE